MKILSVLGTRPEIIKMAPVLRLLEQASWAESVVCVTAQHRDLLDDLLHAFAVRPDIDLDLMTTDQTPEQVLLRSLEGLHKVFNTRKPDIILAQGDTTTALAAAQAAFYLKIPFGHVEAGLRTGDLMSPYPEEMNRILISNLAAIHFAPTGRARANLLAEGFSESSIHVTGNTGIDALLDALDQVRISPPQLPAAVETIVAAVLDRVRRLVVVTVHRRENFGYRLERICQGLVRLARAFSEVDFVFPVHPNPNVRTAAAHHLAGQTNIHLVEPLSYLPFVYLLDRSVCIVTDSGGIQEEAPYLDKPVLVLRDATERAEAVEGGWARLAGAEPDRIVAEGEAMLSGETVRGAAPALANPFGDGRAADRIIALLDQWRAGAG